MTTKVFLDGVEMPNKPKPKKKRDIYDLLFYIPLAAVCLFLGSCFYRWFSVEWRFAHVEQNVRKAISPDQLQNWATNLIAKQRSGNLQDQIPKVLLNIWTRPPSLFIHEGLTNEQGLGYPAHVQLAWGSGIMGHKGLEIGPTNYVSLRLGNQWKPGVYFYTAD